MEQLTPQIASVEKSIEALCADEPIIHVLTTAPGVGLVVAAAFVSVIDDAKRFRNAHQLASYLGLVPYEDTSGGPGRRKLGAITKQGDKYLRCLLVQIAHRLMRIGGREDPLRSWAQDVAKKRGKNIAIIALARRLSGVLWAMWRDGSVYDAASAAEASARGLRHQAMSIEVRAAGLNSAAAKARKPQRAHEKLLAGASSPVDTTDANSASRGKGSTTRARRAALPS